MKTLCIVLLTLSTVLCAVESPAHLIAFDSNDELTSRTGVETEDGALVLAYAGYASIESGTGDIVGGKLGVDGDKTFVIQLNTFAQTGDNSIVKFNADTETVVCVLASPFAKFVV